MGAGSLGLEVPVAVTHTVWALGNEAKTLHKQRVLLTVELLGTNIILNGFSLENLISNLWIRNSQPIVLFVCLYSRLYMCFCRRKML